MKHRIAVLVNTPVHSQVAWPLTYLSEQPLAPGTLLRVPLGQRELLGVVWDAQSGSACADVDPTKLRAIAGTLGEARDVDSFTLRSLSVTTRNAKKLKVATDGEVQWMQLPLRFTVAPRPLQVMLPPLEQRLPPQ